MSSKLLVICGPTATGKTALALSLATKYEGELISADSRQVYKGMDIGTGKDLPKNLKFKINNLKLGPIYEVEGVPVWGYDLVDPKQDFSAGQYATIANTIIEEIQEKGKLPILVGGTGFYIKAVVDGIETALIYPDKKLRKSLDKKLPDELFEILATIDPVKAASMNTSDKKNPRRLVRAIEIANFNLKSKSQKSKLIKRLNYSDVLMVGLSAPKEYINNKIKLRVKKRLENGFEDEAMGLIKNDISRKSQAMQSLGYRQYRDYFEGKISREEFMEEWFKKEVSYAKRQMVWFKKDKRITWIDVSKEGWKENIEKLVGNWYSISIDAKS